MLKSDAILRPITEEMRVEAKQQQAWLHNFHQGNSTTRAVTPNRDIIGDLAHQAVERLLDELSIDYQSTRKVRLDGGDELDIVVMGEKWDVKGTRLPATEFFVFDKQMRNPKVNELDKLVFVQISRDETEARIFSPCPVSLFKEKKQFVPAGSIYNFQYDNWGVALFYLPSFKDWIMGNQAAIECGLTKAELVVDKAFSKRYNIDRVDLDTGN